MKNAVIYARYSSEKQNEQSIAGQIEICRNFAKNNDIRIIDIYADEALSGKVDKRPAFQKMIKDSKSQKFEIVLVYAFDRFARNRYDSAIYKTQLKLNKVKVLSASEQIPDSPEGVILESLLEGMAQYYSENLSRNVTRGMNQCARKSKYLGGTCPLGYRINSENDFVVDEQTAPIVRMIFDFYASGTSMRAICDTLNDSGYRSANGKEFTYNSLHHILKNRKYIGEYRFNDIVIEHGIPQIIDDITFEKVQSVLSRNKHAPAHNKSSVNFYLTGKLFCGHCKSSMVGDSGTSKSNVTHYYYTCLSRKRKRGCKKKSVKKEWIEKLITDITIKRVLTDENIEFFVEKVMEKYKKDINDDSELRAVNLAIKEVQKTIDNIMNAIEKGIITETTKERLLAAEKRKTELIAERDKKQIKPPPLEKKTVRDFLYEVRDGVFNSADKTEIIINTFVNSVYLYDDSLKIVFTLQNENAEPVTLDVDNIACSDIKGKGSPFAYYPNTRVFVIAIKIPRRV